tara:strand:+ start:1152 stop:1304 length:153 start_codon:yes stop_codon:yes gene_type:complete
MYLIIQDDIPIGLYTAISDSANTAKKLKTYKIYEVFPNSEKVILLSEKLK